MRPTRLLAKVQWGEWRTPRWLFDRLNSEFAFTYDLAASRENALCPLFFTQAEDAMCQTWAGSCYCNPPYGNKVGDWMQKAYTSALDGATVVMLVPAYTDVKWFHAWVLGKCAIRFIQGRLKFDDEDATAPFASMLCVYGKSFPPSVSGVRGR